MARFCERCPDRGSCTGDIEYPEVLSTTTQGTVSEDRGSASFVWEYGNPIGPTAVELRYRDRANGVSEVITVRGNSGVDAENNGFEYIGKIGRCSEPKIKKFLGIVVKRECSAPEA